MLIPVFSLLVLTLVSPDVRHRSESYHLYSADRFDRSGKPYQLLGTCSIKQTVSKAGVTITVDATVTHKAYDAQRLLQPDLTERQIVTQTWDIRGSWTGQETWANSGPAMRELAPGEDPAWPSHTSISKSSDSWIISRSASPTGPARTARTRAKDNERKSNPIIVAMVNGRWPTSPQDSQSGAGPNRKMVHVIFHSPEHLEFAPDLKVLNAVEADNWLFGRDMGQAVKLYLDREGMPVLGRDHTGHVVLVRDDLIPRLPKVPK